MNRRIVIAGSYNASMFLKGARIPGIGETYVGDVFFVSPGGKGSNQAIAARFQNADVKYIAKLGNDSYAVEIIEEYKKLGMMNPSITRDPGVHTGIAVIFIDAAGNNSIMVVPGANLRLTAEEIVQGVTEESDVFMAGFQLENDVGEVAKAIRALKEKNVPVLLDPAPAVPLPEDLYPCIEILKPNEHEAELLSGIHVATVEDAFRAGDWFLSKGVGAAIVTLGALGAVVVGKDHRVYLPSPKVEAADTTGAGDIFSGSLLAALAKGFELTEAVRYANCAASISVTRMGVFEAMPTEEETLALYHSLGSQV